MVRLRRLLPEGTLVTRDHGYELRLDPGELDVDRFLCLLERGRDALATGEASRHPRARRAHTLPGTPSAVLAAFGVVWVAVAPRDLLLEISPRSNAVLRTVEIEGGPVALAAGARAVWVATGRGQRLVRVDPDTHAVTATLRLAGIPHALAVASGRVWVVGG